MHEASIAESIVSYLLEYEKKHSFAIKNISLEIGIASGVNIESLSFCLDAVSKALDRMWTFNFIEKKLVFKCSDCLFEFEAEGFDSRCKRCGSLKINPLSGFEMNIFELEGEEVESKNCSSLATGK
ncbi:MAG: hydrogenase maturation nickel metallochaperone HypA [Proteobacteria bacterium]|nr:hydrogenase maturation nickel metallochaperone HypA [Pseudomonadota bacterium]